MMVTAPDKLLACAPCNSGHYWVARLAHSQEALWKQVKSKNAIHFFVPPSHGRLGSKDFAIRLGSKDFAIRLGSKELFAWAPKSYSLGLQRVKKVARFHYLEPPPLVGFWNLYP